MPLPNRTTRPRAAVRARAAAAAARARSTLDASVGQTPAAPRVVPSRSKGLLVQLLRYGVVAVVSMGAEYLVYFTLTEALGVSYLVAGCLGYLVGMATNYTLSITWAFSGHHGASHTRVILRFLLVNSVAFVLNLLLLWVFTAGAGFYHGVSKLLATVIVFVWSFYARRLFVFRHHRT